MNAPLRRAYEFFMENFGVASSRIGVYRLAGASRFAVYRIQKDLSDLLSLTKKAK